MNQTLALKQIIGSHGPPIGEPSQPATQPSPQKSFTKEDVCIEPETTSEKGTQISEQPEEHTVQFVSTLVSA